MRPPVGCWAVGCPADTGDLKLLPARGGIESSNAPRRALGVGGTPQAMGQGPQSQELLGKTHDENRLMERLHVLVGPVSTRIVRKANRTRGGAEAKPTHASRTLGAFVASVPSSASGSAAGLALTRFDRSGRPWSFPACPIGASELTRWS